MSSEFFETSIVEARLLLGVSSPESPCSGSVASSSTDDSVTGVEASESLA